MDEIQCEHCGETVGEWFEIKDPHGKVAGVWAKIGGVFALSVSGRCGKCGKAFHWNAADKRLERLLERLNKS